VAVILRNLQGFKGLDQDRLLLHGFNHLNLLLQKCIHHLAK
jgi:hypothetical protein